MSSSLNERSLTPSSRGVSPVSSRGVCLHAGEPVLVLADVLSQLPQLRLSLLPSPDEYHIRASCKVSVIA